VVAMPRSVVYIAAVVGLAGVVALAAPALAPAAQDDGSASAELLLADGTEVGTVEFGVDDDVTVVEVEIALPTDLAVAAFHGLHVHANDDPANGEGCEADPDEPESTWFTAVDGHLRSGDEAHGHHLGDLPPIQLDDRGRGRAEFDAARLPMDDLDGRAVVLHAEPDNLGHVPTGPGADDYTANSPAAAEKTTTTGNAGPRLACGEIT
jgi:Cu-Zn family superoxide dismutase